MPKTIAETVVGVVTVTYNSEIVLPDFLESVAAQTGLVVKLYVIDNASSDRTLEVLAGWDDRIDFVTIANANNEGIAVGNNQGIEAALADGADWVLTLNNDTMFPSDAFVNLVTEATENNLDVVSPLIEATEPPGSVWYAGGDIIRWQGMKPTHESAGETMADVPRVLRKTPYASTCCLLVRPEVFENVGLMDPVYFVYYDDIDFAIRVADGGYQFWLSPATTIIHKASSLTGGPDSPFFIKWRSRNWVLVARKHTSGIGTPIALAYIQAWAFARLVLRRDSVATWKLRQKSFAEGMRVTTATSAPRLAVTRAG